MTAIDFNQVDEYLSERNPIKFLKLVDDGWYATVRFMYGPGETVQAYPIHNVKTNNGQSDIFCLRGLGQPIDSCPLCAAGNRVSVVCIVPLYVMSITEIMNGVPNTKQINEVRFFRRGTTFKSAVNSVMRQAQGTPLVNNVFNLVRNGKAQDTDTTYTVEFVSRDTTTLQDLPEIPDILNSVYFKNLTFQEMLELNKGSATSVITPRATTNEVVTSRSQVF